MPVGVKLEQYGAWKHHELLAEETSLELKSTLKVDKPWNFYSESVRAIIRLRISDHILTTSLTSE